MSNLGYLVAAYALTGATVGAYLLSLVRRRRGLERRLEQLAGATSDRRGEGAARD